MCAADSTNVEPRLYEHLRRLIEKIDVLFVGMECDGAPDIALRPASHLAGGEKDRAVWKVQRLGLREGDRHREQLEFAAGLRLCDGPGALVKVSHLHSVHG